MNLSEDQKQEQCKIDIEKTKTVLNQFKKLVDCGYLGSCDVEELVKQLNRAKDYLEDRLVELSICDKGKNEIPFMIFEEEVSDYYDLLGIKSEEEIGLEEMLGVDEIVESEDGYFKYDHPKYYEDVDRENLKNRKIKRIDIFKCPVCNEELDCEGQGKHLEKHNIINHRGGVYYMEIKKDKINVVCLICKNSLGCYDTQPLAWKSINKHMEEDHRWTEKIVENGVVNLDVAINSWSTMFNGNFYCSECKQKFESNADDCYDMFVAHVKECHEIELPERNEFEVFFTKQLEDTLELKQRYHDKHFKNYVEITIED